MQGGLIYCFRRMIITKKENYGNCKIKQKKGTTLHPKSVIRILDN